MRRQAWEGGGLGTGARPEARARRAPLLPRKRRPGRRQGSPPAHRGALRREALRKRRLKRHRGTLLCDRSSRPSGLPLAPRNARWPRDWPTNKVVLILGVRTRDASRAPLAATACRASGLGEHNCETTSWVAALESSAGARCARNVIARAGKPHRVEYRPQRGLNVRAFSKVKGGPVFCSSTVDRSARTRHSRLNSLRRVPQTYGSSRASCRHEHGHLEPFRSL